MLGGLEWGKLFPFGVKTSRNKQKFDQYFQVAKKKKNVAKDLTP